MLTHSQMRRIRIIVLKREVDAVTEALGRPGVLELTSAPQETDVPGDAAEATQKLERCLALRERLDALAELLQIGEDRAAPRERMALDAAEQVAAALETDTEALGARLRDLDAKVQAAQDVMDDMEPYRELAVPPSELADTSFLHVTAGDMPEGQISSAREAIPADAVVVPVGTSPGPGAARLRRVLALSSRRSRFALRTVLDDHQFVEAALPADKSAAPAAIYEGARARRDEQRAQRNAVQAALLQSGEAQRDELAQARDAVRRELRIRQAEQNFSATWAAAIITG